MSEDVVNHPKHYTTGFETKPVECIDITQHMSFCAGNAFKYIWRAGQKTIGSEGAVEDLRKARWYLCYIIGHAIKYDEVSLAASAASAAFMFVKDDDSNRYAALRAVVRGHYYSAMNLVDAMISAIMEDNQ